MERQEVLASPCDSGCGCERLMHLVDRSVGCWVYDINGLTAPSFTRRFLAKHPT